MDTKAYLKRNQNLQRVFVWLFLVVSSFVLNLTNLITFPHSAYAADTNIILDVDTTLSLTLSSNSISASVLPTASGVFSSTSFTATASTNNSTGYKLLLINKDTDTNLVHAVTSTATIPTLSSSTTKASFPNNQWGLSLDDTNYLPTPASDGTAITVKETTAPIANDTSTVYAGTKVTTDTMSGAYTDTITISLVANPEPLTFAQAYLVAGKNTVEVGGVDYYKMQDMTKNICISVGEDEQATLVDTRDNKTYTVFKSKAPDSRCWMNQNLDLNLSSDTTLTNQNTDLNSIDSWTPESPNGTTISPGNLSSSTWADDYSNPYSYDPGDVYYYTSGTDADDTEYTSLANCMAAPHTAAECQHYHAGNYYNWSAAVASNNSSLYVDRYVQAPDSICPKGWRLPQGKENSSDYSDFNDLLVAHGIINNGASGDGAYLDNGFSNIRINPLFLVRAGSVDFGSQRYFSSRGLYWSSNAYSARAFNLYLRSGGIDPQNNALRFSGRSIRCLADVGYFYRINYEPNGTNVSNLHNQVTRSENTTYSFAINSLPPARTDYLFLGYATSADGDVAYQPGDSVSLTSSSPTITLYPKWTVGTTFANAYNTAGKLTKNVGGVDYYKMQDMTSGICSSVGAGQETSLVDTRDDTIYTIFKANDGRCWMNQNLDLNLSSDITLTDQDTDINPTLNGGNTSWTPESPNGNTIAPGNLSGSTWTNDDNNPYSYDPGDVYHYTSGTDANDTQYNSLAACMADHTEAECKHYHAGNYYNWSAAVASNDTSAYTTQYTQAPDSICPKGWKLPQGPTKWWDYSDFNDLLAAHGIINNGASGSGVYLENGFNNLRATPLFSIRAGRVSNTGSFEFSGIGGFYWLSSVDSADAAMRLYFLSNSVYSHLSLDRAYGFPVRCLAR